MTNYLNEFTSKYGFQYGNNVPDGASDVRELYVTYINHQAKQAGSAFRAFPFNRPGLLNPCMIVFGPKDDVNLKHCVTLENTDDAFKDAWNETLYDDPLEEHIYLSLYVSPDVYEELGIPEPNTLECRNCGATSLEDAFIQNGLCADCAKNIAQKNEKEN